MFINRHIILSLSVVQFLFSEIFLNFSELFHTSINNVSSIYKKSSRISWIEIAQCTIRMLIKSFIAVIDISKSNLCNGNMNNKNSWIINVKIESSSSNILLSVPSKIETVWLTIKNIWQFSLKKNVRKRNICILC